MQVPPDTSSGISRGQGKSSSHEASTISSLIDELLLSISEIKFGLEQLLIKVDSCGSNPNVNSFLDSLSVTSGQMNMLCRKLSTSNVAGLIPNASSAGIPMESKYSLLNKIVFHPRNLSVETDPHLMRLTEERARCFDHELAPLYLRTKLIPTLENKVQVLAESAEEIEKGRGDEFDGGVTAVNNNKDVIRKIVDDLDLLIQSVSINLARNDPANTIPMCTTNDTAYLLAAMTDGRGLKMPNNNLLSMNNDMRRNFPLQSMMASSGGAVVGSQSGMSQMSVATSGNQQRLGQTPNVQPPVVATTIVNPIIRSAYSK